MMESPLQPNHFGKFRREKRIIHWRCACGTLRCACGTLRWIIELCLYETVYEDTGAARLIKVATSLRLGCAQFSCWRVECSARCMFRRLGFRYEREVTETPILFISITANTIWTSQLFLNTAVVLTFSDLTVMPSCCYSGSDPSRG